MKKPPALAKIMPPRLPAVFLRTRLFRRLDRAAQRSVVWVAGPPGAGKTTLVASFLTTRKLRGLWYRVDEGDADAATVFYYLRLAAAKVAPWHRRPLPLLTPEYLPGLATFTHRYFQDLYGRLKAPFVVVFDNYQEMAPDSVLHTILRDGLAELPEGGRVIVISRSSPPPALARVRASRAMEILGWDELRLTPEEARGIARLQWPGQPAANLLRAVHEQTDGWAAGLVLLLERLKAEALSVPAPGRLPCQAVFDYFAGEILAKTDPETRDFLLETALLPRMTAGMAELVTGLPQAGRILSDLARQHYFTVEHASTVEHADAEPVYEYHPLFREFLLARAREAVPKARRSEVQRAAAALLDAADQVEDAVRLLREATDWPGLAALIQRQARALLAQGRHRTLEEWLRSFPAAVVEQNPWLRYWLGACRLPFAPAESRRHFELAFERFKADDDPAGQFLAWAGVVETYVFEWGVFTPLDRWIAALDEMLARYPVFPSPEIEARVTSSMFFALMFRQPHHPDLPRWAERVWTVLQQSPLDVGHRIVIGAHLIHYSIWTGDLARGGMVLDLLRPVVRTPEIAPLALVMWRTYEAMYGWLTGAVDACMRAVAEGLETVDRTGIHLHDLVLLAEGGYGALSADDPEGATPYLRRMASAMDAARPLDSALYHYVTSWQALAQGDLPRALEHARTALAQTDASGVPFPQGATSTLLAEVLFDRGERQEAERHLARVREIGHRMRSRTLEFMYLLTAARFALDRGDEAAGLALLREAMALGRRQGFVNSGGWRHAVMARLCAKALEAGIEVEYVQGLIRKRGLVPDEPPLEIEPWPWPVKLVTLGRFQVLRDGELLTFSGKAQRRPLELLEALIAFGGREVSETRLTEALWPGAEGDAAHRAFDTTLHRLRKLLGADAALVLRRGRLSLDSRICWVDTWALQRVLERVEAALKAIGAANGAADDLDRLAERALALYQGPFLGEDASQPWALTLRERLASQMLRLLARLGRHWEQAGQWPKTLDCYEKGLELDDCAEELYQRLMIGYRHLGRLAEALTVYRRCQQALSTRLGTEPSSQTEAIRTGLRTRVGV